MSLRRLILAAANSDLSFDCAKLALRRPAPSHDLAVSLEDFIRRGHQVPALRNKPAALSHLVSHVGRMSRHAVLELAADHRMLGQGFGKGMHGPALPFGCRRERDRSLSHRRLGFRAAAGDSAQPFSAKFGSGAPPFQPGGSRIAAHNRSTAEIT